MDHLSPTRLVSVSIEPTSRYDGAVQTATSTGTELIITSGVRAAGDRLLMATTSLPNISRSSMQKQIRLSRGRGFRWSAQN